MSEPLRFPVVSHSAEFLVMAHLMRRNILTYKAPPNFAGYDLICIHPNPRLQHRKALRIQVKSRYQTDNNRHILLQEQGLDGFDFLVAVFLNIGYFSWKGHKVLEHPENHVPEFYCFPNKWIREHHNEKAGWGGKIKVGADDPTLKRFKNQDGLNLIAKALSVAYPERAKSA